MKKNFIWALEEEFLAFKKSISSLKQIKPPIINGKIVNNESALLLGLWAYNRDLPTKFVNLKDLEGLDNLIFISNPEIVKVSISKIGSEILVHKKSVLEFIPDYNFEFPTPEQRKNFITLVNSGYIDAFPMKGKFAKFSSDKYAIASYKHCSIEEKEVINIEFYRGGKIYNSPEIVDNAIDRDFYMSKLPPNISAQIREFSYIFYNIENVRKISLEGLKNLETINFSSLILDVDIAKKINLDMKEKLSKKRIFKL